MKLFRKKEIECPTLAGWLFFIGAAAGFLLWGLLRVYPFLSPTKPLPAETLVVEGWLEDAELAQVLAVFEAGDYQQIIATGGEITYARDFMPYPNYAEMTYHRLLAAGVATNQLTWTSSGYAVRDRTYCSALALRAFLKGRTASIDLVSAGPHARRSWRLFRLGLGESCPVGIISIEPHAFNGRNWWTCSDGVRSVVDEAIAWFYARWIFKPVEVDDE